MNFVLVLFNFGDAACTVPNPPSRYLVRSGLARPLASQNIEPQRKQAANKTTYAGSRGSYEPELQHLQLGGTYLSIQKTTVRIDALHADIYVCTTRTCFDTVCATDLPLCMCIHSVRQCTGLASSMGFFLGLAYLSFQHTLLPSSEPANGQATHSCWRVPCWSVLCPGKAV